MSEKKQTKTDAADAAEVNDNPHGYPRFLAPAGEPVLVCLTRGGHSASIGTDAGTEGKGTPLHPRFHRAAVMLGCMPVGLQSAVSADDLEVARSARNDRAGLLRNAIAEMVALAADDAAKRQELFTNDGRPDARAMSIRLGFPVTASDRDDAWKAYAGDEGDEV